jgi:hypothetical protein
MSSRSVFFRRKKDFKEVHNAALIDASSVITRECSCQLFYPPVRRHMPTKNGLNNGHVGRPQFAIPGDFYEAFGNAGQKKTLLNVDICVKKRISEVARNNSWMI